MSEKPKIRNTRWGASQEEVRKSEKWAKGLSRPNTLRYTGKIFQHECNLMYEFNSQGSLYKLTYEFSDPANTLYYPLQCLLREKYGETVQSLNGPNPWVIHAGQTQIKLFERSGKICIHVEHVGEKEEKIYLDSYTQAWDELV